MLTSISSISLICLVLAYSGWDSVDPPPADGIHNTGTPFKLDIDEFVRIKGYILQWFLIHDDQYEFNTDCCGIPLRYPEKHELMSMKLFQQNNMAEKRLQPDDPIYFLSADFPATMRDNSTEGINRKPSSHLTSEELPSRDQEIPEPTLTATPGSKQEMDDSATRKQTTFATKQIGGTLNPVQKYVYSVYKRNSDNTTTATTDDKYFLHLSERLYKRFTAMNDMINDIRGFIFSGNESLTRQPKNTTQDECDDDDDVQNGHDDDEVALVIMLRLCFLAVVYQYRRMRRLTYRTPTKGFTKTPILYKDGKYLELGLSKYFRHRPIVISQTPPPSSRLLSMENMLNINRLDTTNIVGVDLKSHVLSANPVSARISKSCSCLPLHVSRNDFADRPRPFLSLPMLPIVSTWLQEEMTFRFPGMITKKPATEGRNQDNYASTGLTKVDTISPPCYKKPKTLGAALVHLSQELPSMGSNTSFYEKMTLLICGFAVNRWTTDNQMKGNLPSQD